MDLFLKIVFGLLGLNIIIFVHELGHFFAAKACGVGVDTFSIGWGKKLVGFKFHDTMYQLAVLPIGGFCKLKGELFKPDFNEDDFQRAKTEPRSFLAAALWKKIVIVVFGPLASFVFAIIVFAFLHFVGFNIYTAGNRIVLSSEISALAPGRVLPADRADLRTGDRIVSVNGIETRTFYDISEAITKAKKREALTLVVERDGETISKSIAPVFDKDADKYIIGISEWVDPIVGMLDNGKVGKKAGLEIGDRIVAVNETPVANRYEFIRVFAGKPASATIYVSRNDTIVPLTMKLDYSKDKSPDLGIGFTMVVEKSPKLGFFASIGKGGEETLDLIVLIVKSFGKIFSMNNIKGLDDVVAGPVRLTQMVGEEATFGFSFGIAEGFSRFFRFICILSVLISFMNLLPIPALDGGQVVLSVIMGVRKNLSLKFVYRYQLVGFSFMFILLVLAILSDAFHFL
jgi:regulator of sigma E protease